MSVHFVRYQQQTAVPPVDEIDLARTVESNTSFKHLFKTGSVLHKSLNSGRIISEGGARWWALFGIFQRVGGVVKDGGEF